MKKQRSLAQIRREVADAVMPPVESIRLMSNQIVMDSEEFGPKQYTSVFEHSADASARVARTFLGIRGNGHYHQFMQTPAYKRLIDAVTAYYDFEIGMLRAERGIV